MKKLSRIWHDLNDDDFSKLVQESKMWKDVLSAFGLNNKGGNYQTLKRRVKELNLDTSHFSKKGVASIKTKARSKEDSLELFCENSNASRTTLKRYILKYELIKYKCTKCLNEGNWMESRLALQLEHINGKPDDNRLSNLCFLCPNCHSQTSSYAGRNIKMRNSKFCGCGTPIKGNGQCRKCHTLSSRGKKYNHKKKILWPTPEKMKELVWETSTSSLARILGVSDSAIGKFCKVHNIPKPSRGYWTKFLKNRK